MSRLSRIVVSLILLAASTAQGSDFSELMHKFFENEAGRQPTGPELSYHANLARQQGPLENYVALCASDDYFVNRCQQNYEVYVTNLYRTFLVREPRPDEVRFWVYQFMQSGGIRTDTLRRFLQANHITQLQGFPPQHQPPAYRPPAAGREIAAELVTQTELFTKTAQQDLGGTWFGRSLTGQSAKLQTVAAQYLDVVRSRSTTAEQLRLAADNLEVALQGVEAEFHRVPNASPQCQDILWRISQLVTSARAAGQASYRPDAGVIPPQGLPASVSSGVETLRNQLRSFAYGLRYYQNRGPVFDRLSRDVQGLLTQVESLSLMVRQGQSRAQLRCTAGALASQANSISGQVGQTEWNIQRGWWAVQQQLQQVTSDLGVSGAWSNVSQPVIVGHPSWQQVPHQPQPSGRPPNRNRNVVDLCDQLLKQIQRSEQALIPLIGRNPDAARLRVGLLNLQGRVQVLRQTAAASGYGSRLDDAANRVMQQYGETSKQFAAAVSRDATLNSPGFYQVGETIQRLRYAAAGVPQ